MAETSWRVTSAESTSSGMRYTVVLGDREWIVLHAPGGWQFWNGQSRCEADGGVRAAVLEYENGVPPVLTSRRFTTTMQEIEDEAIRTGFEHLWTQWNISGKPCQYLTAACRTW